MSGPKSAILLLAHGSPSSPADIPQFMKHITGGRPVPDAVIKEITHRYSLIGKSPLTEITMHQAEALQSRLGLPVYVGMRNWKPFISDAVQQMVGSGVNKIVAICLAPQNSSTSVGLYSKALADERKPGMVVQFVESWHDHPLLIQAFVERLEPVWRDASAEMGSALPVIFTAHSVPMRTIQAGDPYEKQAKETAQLVGRQVTGLTSELQHFAFQSQGMTGGPWLGPTVESAMLEMKKQGHNGVVIAPIGFVCDHVEVLYDIDIGFHQFAHEQQLKMWRPESLNTSATFVAALAKLASTRMALASGIVSLA
ncbi:MAG TPA: ferrochelatase [Candidatus Polarisedimenticolia bacterium]|jgi:ferrochelatase|nr:ferrochelatase [Candidatus Polarisedimenticolia bacterium]